MKRHTSRRIAGTGFAATTVMVLVAASLSITAAMLSVPAASATAASAPVASAAVAPVPTPGVPVTVYQEDFQNRPAPTPIVRLTDYTGSTGQKYTADAAWLKNCNGWITSANESPTAAAQVADCLSQKDWNGAQQLAQALGIFNGQSTADAADNYVDSAYTSANPGVDGTEFQTASNVPLASADRFISFGVDVSAYTCPPVNAAPLLQFSLLDESGNATPAGSLINACTSKQTVVTPAVGNNPAITATVGHYTANGAILFSGSSLGVKLVNSANTGAGNDHAIDNIKILDVTPGLSESFDPETVATGGISRLTFTITNTTELGAKDGWSFDDTLPAGLTVASDPDAVNNCPSGQINLPADGAWVRADGSLSVGMASCTVSINVTSATAGTYSNGPDRVTTTGLDPTNNATVNFQSPAITILKHAGTPVDVNHDGLVDAGDTIGYTFDVTNTGDVPLSEVAVTDAKAGAVNCPDSTLAPGVSETCTAAEPYVITAADQSAGAVDNTATAGGMPPNTTIAITSAPSTTHTVTTAPNPAITVEKSASPSDEAHFTVGQVITYSFVLTNTGNVALTNVHPTETSFTGSGVLAAPECPVDTPSLAPGDEITCTAGYTLTQDDVDAGFLTNNATATGTPPNGPPTVSPEVGVTIAADQRPSVSLVKSASPATITKAGQTVTYSFLITNTGNVAVTSVAPVEGDFSGSGKMSDIVCPDSDGKLLPGAHTICTAADVATQTDVDAGTITNTATATGTPPEGGSTPTSLPSTALVVVPAKASMTVVKTADTKAITAAGQKLTYSFLVTNTGNVTVWNVSVAEGTFSGTGKLQTPVCPGTGELLPLAPGAHLTCTATYVVTEADVAAGPLTNTATAVGSPPYSAEPTSSSPSTVTIPVVAPLAVIVVPLAPLAPVIVPLTPLTPLAATGISALPQLLFGGTILLLLGGFILLVGLRRRRTS